MICDRRVLQVTPQGHGAEPQTASAPREHKLRKVSELLILLECIGLSNLGICQVQTNVDGSNVANTGSPKVEQQLIAAALIDAIICISSIALTSAHVWFCLLNQVGDGVVEE